LICDDFILNIFQIHHFSKDSLTFWRREYMNTIFQKIKINKKWWNFKFFWKGNVLVLRNAVFMYFWPPPPFVMQNPKNDFCSTKRVGGGVKNTWIQHYVIQERSPMEFFKEKFSIRMGCKKIKFLYSRRQKFKKDFFIPKIFLSQRFFYPKDFLSQRFFNGSWLEIF
jgi:hypothetical protein